MSLRFCFIAIRCEGGEEMKIHKKWLVVGIVGNRKRIATSFRTIKEAEYALDFAGFIRNDVNEWQDSLGQIFKIEKNTKEY